MVERKALSKEPEMKFKTQVIVFLLLSIAIGCTKPGSVTEEALPSETLPPTSSHATSTPEVVTATEDVFVPPAGETIMLYIPAGDFLMGSTESQIDTAIALCNQHYSPCNRWYYEREGPQHSVSLDAYWIDQTEVSNARYRLCVQVGVCAPPITCKKGQPTFDDPEKADHPVICVGWEDAQTYCQWAGGRLPTEAEWEYAFRGASGSIYPWGNEFDGSRLNYCDANCSQSFADERFDDGYSLTAPVGGYPSGVSWSGAYNMGGNVSEWVADWFGEYSQQAAANPSGPQTGNEKMLKGCNWFSNPAYCRGAMRPSVSPDTRFDYLGFRCARSEEGETEMLTEPVVIPLGGPPALDGTITSGEWSDATVENFADGSELFLMRDGEYLYLGIRAKEPGMIAGNVFIQRDDEIFILHSSAALGTAVYRHDEAVWQQTRDFAWRCRDTGNSEAAQAERAEFLQDEGWLAANGLMGTPNELEYKIKIPDQEFRLAVVYIKSTPPYEKVPWPASLDDDSIEPVQGEMPLEMRFSPEQWGILDLGIVNPGE